MARYYLNILLSEDEFDLYSRLADSFSTVAGLKIFSIRTTHLTILHVISRSSEDKLKFKTSSMVYLVYDRLEKKLLSYLYLFSKNFDNSYVIHITRE